MRFLAGVLATWLTIAVVAAIVGGGLYLVNEETGVITRVQDAYKKLENLPL